MMSSNSKRPIVIWLFTGCFLVFAMVIIGGITRLTGSGLSITTWNLVMGAIPPLNHNNWLDAFHQYQQSPQFKIVNSDMTLDQFKHIFFWEYFHRLMGRVVFLWFFIPFAGMLYLKISKRKELPQIFIPTLIICALIGLQGLLGWYMVASGLVDVPAVSHYWLAAHLICAFITFGYILWVALGLIYNNEDKLQADMPFKKISLVIMITAVIQIIYGAFVAGLHAGKIYNTWPKMGADWFPDTIVFYQPFISNFFENRIGVQFVHRYIALVLVCLGLILFFRFRKHPFPSIKGSVLFFLCALGLQFTLGVLTLIYAAPITLAVFHQIGGFVLFTSAVILLHRAVKPESSGVH
jgi:heme a synthase